MQRETITITTPISKQEVILKSYLTVGEKRKIKKVLFSKAKFEKDGLQTGLDGDSIEEMQNITITETIVSIDKSTENILEVFLNLRSKDGDFILTEIDKITETEEEKKN